MTTSSMFSVSAARGSGKVGAVAFDLGGVVCHFVPERRLELLANISHLPKEVVLARIWESDFVVAADSGSYTKETEFDYVRQALDLSCTYQTFRSIWCSAFAPESEVLRIVDLVRTNATAVILSDNGPVILEGLYHELSQVRRSFDHVFLSWQCGATKPDGELFRTVQRALGLDPHRILLIDDTERNIDGARREGWRAVLFKTPKHLLSELRKHELISWHQMAEVYVSPEEEH